MFEVLLQADRALANGALDQAERSYWQLVELDPTNAIALTGLARVALERGDIHLSRELAARALSIDPDAVAARRLLDAIEGRDPDSSSLDLPDLTLLAAQRLEELSRRRAVPSDQTAGGEVSATAEARPPEPATQSPEGPVPSAEPLRARRQAGRESAAAAAAAAAETVRLSPPRLRTHQALGDRARRRLLPEDIKLPVRMIDPFAAAESAAAIEAVDATEDEEIVETVHQFKSPGAPAHLPDEEAELEEQEPTVEERTAPEAVETAATQAEPSVEPEAAGVGAEIESVEAESIEDSIALRLALLGDLSQYEPTVEPAAEPAAQTQAREEQADLTETPPRPVAEGPKEADVTVQPQRRPISEAEAEAEALREAIELAEDEEEAAIAASGGATGPDPARIDAPPDGAAASEPPAEAVPQPDNAVAAKEEPRRKGFFARFRGGE